MDQFGYLAVSYWHNTDIVVIRQYLCFKISYQYVGQVLNIKYLFQMLKAGREKFWKTLLALKNTLHLKLLNSYMILLLNGGIIKWRERTPSERFCCQGETSIKYLFFRAHAGPMHHPADILVWPKTVRGRAAGQLLSGDCSSQHKIQLSQTAEDVAAASTSPSSLRMNPRPPQPVHKGEPAGETPGGGSARSAYRPI